MRRARRRRFCRSARRRCNRRGSCWPHPCSPRRRFLRVFFRLSGCFRRRFRFGLPQNVLANFLGHVRGDRARMRLLLCDPVPGQKVNDCFGLHLKFAGQLVDSDLVCVAHASYRPFFGQKFHRPQLRRGQLSITLVALPQLSLRLRGLPPLSLRFPLPLWLASRP